MLARRRGGDDIHRQGKSGGRRGGNGRCRRVVGDAWWYCMFGVALVVRGGMTWGKGATMLLLLSLPRPVLPGSCMRLLPPKLRRSSHRRCVFNIIAIRIFTAQIVRGWGSLKWLTPAPHVLRCLWHHPQGRHRGCRRHRCCEGTVSVKGKKKGCRWCCRRDLSLRRLRNWGSGEKSRNEGKKKTMLRACRT